MKLQLLLGLLLVVTAVQAAGLDSDYLIIAETPRDVVAGANFAAAVNNFATFSAVLMEDAQTLSDDELRDKYIVIIQGNKVSFLGRDDYSAVFERYFRERDYELEYLSLPRQDDVHFPDEPELPEVEDEVVVEVVPEPEEVADEIEAQVVEVIAEPVEEFVCEGCVLDEQCYAVGEIVDVDGVTHDCTATGLVPHEEPGFFAKIINWFRNLF